MGFQENLLKFPEIATFLKTMDEVTGQAIQVNWKESTVGHLPTVFPKSDR